MLLEKSGEIIPEGMKRQSQSKNNTQLLMWLVMEVKSELIQNFFGSFLLSAPRPGPPSTNPSLEGHHL